MRVSGISYSSDKKLARCEMQYEYRYGQKLKARVKKKGLYMGDVVHQLLDPYRKKEDWKKKFTEWKKTSWDKLFDEEREMYEEKKMSPALVLDLFSHYVEHWSEEDAEWEPVLVEEDFELMTKLGVPVRFKADYVARHKKEGVLALFENKNNEEIPDAEQRMLAPQVHGYCFLLSKIKTKKFPQGLKIQRIVWDYIRTTPVTCPTINKDGSISKRKINTDQRTYLRFLKENKIHPKGDEVIGLENFLKGLPETLSVLRVVNRPNLKIGEMFVRQWIERARRAQSIQQPLRTWSRDCSWSCDYFNLCQADMLGKPDRNTIISRDFVRTGDIRNATNL